MSSTQYIDNLLNYLNNKKKQDNDEPLEEIEVNGEKGVWVNKEDDFNWTGDIPLSEYKINVDNNPLIIHKKPKEPVEYERLYGVRYLKPKSPQPPGDIVIVEEPSIPGKELTPLVIRQVPTPTKEVSEEIFYREAPPDPPKKVEPLIVKIPGKKLPPPPRKVIIEILPKIPTKPRPILLERWLTPKPVKRRVIFEKAPVIPTSSLNEKPEVVVNKKYYYIDTIEEMGTNRHPNSKEIDMLVNDLARSQSQKDKNKRTRSKNKQISRSFSASLVRDMKQRRTRSKPIHIDI